MNIQKTNLNENVLNSKRSVINSNNVSFGAAVSSQLDYFLSKNNYPEIQKGIRRQIQDHLAAFCDGITNLFDKFQGKSKIDLRSQYKDMFDQTGILVDKLGLSSSSFEFVDCKPIKEGAEGSVELVLKHKDSGKKEFVRLIKPDPKKEALVYDVVIKDESGKIISSFSQSIDNHFPDFSRGSTQDIIGEEPHGMYLCNDFGEKDKFWNQACELFNSLIKQFKEISKIQKAENGFNNDWFNRHN
jgi:hypothetical protein